MQVVEAHEALASHDADEGDGHAFVVVALDDLEEVDAQNLEHHHEVLAVLPAVEEAIEELHAVAVVAVDVG